MKKLLIIFCIIASQQHFLAQTFNMCVGSNSTAASSGTLYDSGGPGSSYSNYEYCSFLINSGCSGTIALTFSSFSTEGCCDYLSVYNGSTTAAPLIGTYSGSSLPPTLYASSGKMFLQWSSDGSGVYPGWAATWTSTLSGMLPPVANFSMNLNPPLNSPIQFTDLTTNSPNQWYWQFGDGTTSTLQNPVKTYTSSGVKSVSLSATNCTTSSNAVIVLTVQTSPAASVNPVALSGTVGCGASAIVPLTLYNTGSGSMVYTFSNASPTTQIKILAITNYVDMSTSGEYNNTFAALNTYFTNYSVTPHFLSSVSLFTAALAGKDVLLIPEQETYPSTGGFMQTYSASIISFVNAGGTAILCGTGYMNQINDIGLFNCSSISIIGPSTPISIVDTLNPIMSTIPIGSMNSLNATWYSTFTNAGNNDYIKYFTNTVVTKRNIGLGRAIYIGFDYFAYDNNAAKLMANSVKTSGGGSTWAVTSTPSGSVAPSSSTTVTFTFNTANLAAGVYTQNIIVQTNSSGTPTMSVPFSYTVVGSASSSISPLGCVNFGSIFQNASKLDSVLLYNTGCATMTVTTSSVNNSVYTYTPSSTFTIAAFSSKNIYVTFNPVLIGAYSATLQTNSNGGTSTVCLIGSATAAPSISVSPTSLNAILPACGSTQTVGLSIKNTGGSNLIYSISGNLSSAATVSVLAITNFVDMSSTGEYTNMITAINSNFTNYSITQHTLTSVPNLQAALVGKRILLIPEQETYSGSGFMQTYSTAINSFVSSGGTAIICGTYDPTQLNDIGLFSSSGNNLAPSGAGLTVLDTTDAVTKTIPLSILSQNATIYHTFTSPGVYDLVRYGSFPVVSTRTIGLGRAIYLGFDYFAYDNNTAKLLSNSIKNSNSSVSWFNGSSNTGTLGTGANNTITYTFNTTGLAAGIYTYNLVIASNDPLATSYTVPVTLLVGSNPCANFTYNNPNNCTGIVTFTQNVLNPVNSYSWSFGNGGTSNLANPTCNYTSPGTYTVSLTACMNTSCSTTSKTLTISNVGGPLSAICAPTSYSYSSYTGILNVSLNTINKPSGYAYVEGYQDFSCTNQTSLTIGSTYLMTINTSPSYYENVSVWIDFDNNGQFSGGEQILSSINKLITHTLNFSPPATAVLNTPLRMRVIDEDAGYSILSGCYNSNYGQAEDYAVTIKPNNVPPVANFNFNANQCQGTVSFSDISSDQPTSWLWNFGDGGVSTLQNPVHTYSAGGSFTVTLVATNSFGSNFMTKTITVNPLLFTIGHSGNLINSPVSFTTNFTSGQVYTWNFGNGFFSGNQSPTSTYTAMGTFTVSLTIVSGTCVNTSTTLVVINDAVNLSKNTATFQLDVYPNPFTKVTGVSLQLSEAGNVNIELLNSNGELIQSISNEYMSLGEHKFELREIPSGVYYLKVQQGTSSRNFKLISLN